MRRILVILWLAILLGVAALAQDPGSETADDNGFVINFLQNTISAPGRQIRLNGVTGALSSQARIASLTIGDDDGVWLRLHGVEIDWSRLALLRGRVSINRLAVERIEVLRRPVPHEPKLGERLPQVTAKPFALPELPVSVQVAALDLPQIDIAAPVIGQPAQLGATGAADLARGALKASLDLRRLDAPGALTLALDFSNATRRLDLALRLQEPEGGVIATLLDIEGRPAIDLRVQGAGPLDALDVDLAFDAGGARIAGGTVALRGGAEGLGFTAELSGGLATVVPAPYRSFFAGETSVELAGVRLADGGVRLDRLALRGAALDLTGALQTAPDGFPGNLTLAGRLGNPLGPAVTLPIPGAATTIHSAVLHLAYGAGRRWSGVVTLDRLAAGDIEVEDLTLTLGGVAEHLYDPARRNLTFALDGVATGVWSADPDVAAVLGTRLDVFADAVLPPGGPLDIRQAQVSGNGVSVFAAGDLRGLEFDGRLAAKLADLAPASGLAGRDLGGALDLRMTGSVNPLSGGFDLALDGTANNLRLGDPRLDGLLNGETTLGGRVARDAEGVRSDGFRLTNPQVEITSTGGLTTEGVSDFAIDARLANLADVDPRLGGALTATGRARGSGRPVAITFDAEIAEGRLLDYDLTAARLGFEGAIDGAKVTGALSGGGRLDDLPITLAGDLALDGANRSLRGLSASIGPNRMTGDVSQAEGGPIIGELALDAPDVTPLAALALAEASGSLTAQFSFQPAEVGQGVKVDATARDLVFGATAIGSADIDALVVDALGRPLVQGGLTAANLRAGGLDVTTLSANARQTGAASMDFTARARLATGTDAELSGALERLPDGFAASLATLGLRQNDVAARLTAPATITVRGGAVELTPLTLALGGGQVTARGTIADNFDIDLNIRALPLAIANTVQPALGLGGTVAGSARVTGPRATPDVRFDVTGEDIVSAQTRTAGLPPLRMTATGRTANQQLQVNADLAATGLDARATGSVPLGAGPLELDVTLAAFPLAIIDRVAGNRGLQGDVSGSAQLRGTLAAPTATFNLRGAGVSATPLRDAGVAPLALRATGRFERNALTLSAAEVSNGQGLAVTGAGRVPLSGPGLDMRASGAAPLTLANTLLASRTAQATGLARFDLTATGSIRAPRLGGSASLAGGGFIDPQTNIRLQDISLDAGLEGQQVVLRNFRAAVPAGGSITAAGTVSLARGNPADLDVRFDRVRYTDGTFIATTLDGELRLRGPATGGGGVLSGEIDLGRTEISVAEGLGANALEVLEEVRHINTPAGVETTLQRAGLDTPRTPKAAGRLDTDIRINAPSQIFVRGRGLDVELGGSLRVRGPTNDLAPVGEFTMRRGRLDVLGQRITFDQGSLQLVGNLDPQINFVAETTSNGFTAYVTVKGRVSSPEIAFSSSPPLPPDEVLAQVIFNRSVSDLSAFQIAQLAAAAAELAGGGGGGPGILDQLRSATGFDDLDIVTADDGETALRAGRYIDDNIYLDLQAETGGETRAQINLDVTDNFTVRGSVESDGNSTLGIFFQRDY